MSKKDRCSFFAFFFTVPCPTSQAKGVGAMTRMRRRIPPVDVSQLPVAVEVSDTPLTTIEIRCHEAALDRCWNVAIGQHARATTPCCSGTCSFSPLPTPPPVPSGTCAAISPVAVGDQMRDVPDNANACPPTMRHKDAASSLLVLAEYSARPDTDSLQVENVEMPVNIMPIVPITRSAAA